jgi:L-asparaginase II
VTEPVVVADIVRSGFVEGHHYGSVVVTAPDGSIEWSIGAVDRPVFPRSTNKPLQVLGMLRNGLDLDGELLALAGASHSGEDFHIDGVRRILAGAGLDESALQTPAEYPLDEPTRDEWIRAGLPKSRIASNCSGKHAAMLATCVVNDWPIATYRDPEHPLQQAIRAAVEDVTGEKVAAVGVDGCGAPVLALTIAGIARAFGLFAAAAGGDERRIADAFRTHPEYVSGTRWDEPSLIRAIPGLLCKGGAEAAYGLGLPDGRGIALKIADGAQRARPVVMAATLRRLGYDHPVLDEQRELALLGGGERVGSVRPAAVLDG